MSRTVGKEIHLIKDIWIAYAEMTLKENPSWWSRYKNKCKHYRLGYFKGQEMIEVDSYPRFRRVIEYYFDRAKQAIINGEAINITAHIGKICGKRVERDFRKKKQRRVDWHKTRQQPKAWDKERNKMAYVNTIYFTTNEWCRIAWVKNGMVENETVYEFAPAHRNSAATSGFKLEFSNAQKADPLLKYRYLYNPLKLAVNGI